MAGEKSKQKKIAEARQKIRAEIEDAYARLFEMQHFSADEARELARKRVQEGNISRRTLEKVLVHTAKLRKQMRLGKDRALGKKIAKMQFGAKSGRMRIK